MEMFGWDSLKKLGTRKRPANGEATPATKCAKCGEMLIKKVLEDNLNVCPNCDHHHYLDPVRRLDSLLDEGSFQERDADLTSLDPLDFRGPKTYLDKLAEARRTTGRLSALLGGEGRLKTRRLAVGVTDSAFIMGSMGSVVGEKLVRLCEFALEQKLPLLMVSGSGGGARMYEGLHSLMQMAKTSAALGDLAAAGLPFISVVTDCTMAGVWASWAALGDIIIAEPKALVGFTGPRVIKTTINCELPAGFQLSEFLLEKGQVDMIVHRRELRDRLASILDKLCGATSESAA